MAAKRATLASADRRAMLMARMMEAVEVAPALDGNPAFETDLAAAFARCRRCPQATLCQRWLDGDAGNLRSRDFCPNHGLFSRLREAALADSPRAVAPARSGLRGEPGVGTRGQVSGSGPGVKSRGRDPGSSLGVGTRGQVLP